MDKNIVLLHGWGASTSKLFPLENALRELGWKVANLKLPGFELKETETISNLNDYSEYVVKDIQKRFNNREYFVFGHSFGGRVAIKIALNNLKYLKGIILCSSGGISRASLLKRFSFLIFAKLGKILQYFLPLGYYWKKLIYKAAREHDYEKAEGKMKLVLKNIISENLKKSIKNVKTPSLILWGKDDKMTPLKDGRYLEKHIKKSNLIVFDGVGHKLPYEKPSEIAEEIEKWHKNLI